LTNSLLVAGAALAIAAALIVGTNAWLWRRDRQRARRLKLEGLRPPTWDLVGTLPGITFLIAAWEEGPFIGRCLEALFALPYPNLQVVLCAGGPDGTYEIAARYCEEHLVLLEQYPGEGKQHALARGLSAASGDVIYLTDADCVITEPTFRWCIEPILQGREPAVSGTFYLPAAMQRSIPFVVLQAASRAYSAASLPPYITGMQGGNCALRRSVLEQAGGFGSVVRTGTDYDLAKRVVRAGCRIRYQVHSSIQSEFPSTLQGYFRQQARWIRNVVLHGLRFGAYPEVLACLRTSALGAAMLGAPFLGVLLTLPSSSLAKHLGLALLAAWGAAFAFALLARLRYLDFARTWLGLSYPARQIYLLPYFMVIDWLAWTLPLVEYGSRRRRNRW